MMINHSLLSIPPYISTSWKNILSLHVEADHPDTPVLVVTLLNHQQIKIPNLDITILENVFKTHALVLEQESSFAKPSEQKLPGPFGPLPAFSFSIGQSLKGKDMEGLAPLNGMMQHNPEEASAPDLPKEMLNKISSISKAMGLDKQLQFMPKAEPHCNCPYCQITRALGSEPEDTSSIEEKKPTEDIVSDQDLIFKDWEVKEIGSELYEVSHPLDPNEKYQVFLGTPLGCTCGCKHCEHVKAVLNT